MKAREAAISPVGFGRLVVFMFIASLAIVLPTKAFGAPVRLMVDPGHGGKDPGAIGGRVAEKTTNLQISKYVVAAAKRQGWQVAMTRNKDVFVPLEMRTAKARAFKATDMVSIHSNSMGGRPKGNMTIFRTKADRHLGKQIMREIGPMTSYADIGNKRDVRGLAVLRTASVPTVIVEVLSLSSPKERATLTTPKFQKQYAEAIVRGVAEHRGVKYLPPTAAKPKPAAKPRRVEKPKAPAKAKPVAAPKPASVPAATPAADTIEKTRDGEAKSELKAGARVPKSAPVAEPRAPKEASRTTERRETEDDTLSAAPKWLQAVLDIIRG